MKKFITWFLLEIAFILGVFYFLFFTTLDSVEKYLFSALLLISILQLWLQVKEMRCKKCQANTDIEVPEDV